MNLFQYEQFFKKHFDEEVRSRGTFLINLVNQLQMELLVYTWASTPTVQCGNTRIDDLNLRALLYAIDRHGGNKTEAVKWLGLSRETIYRTMRKWNKTKAKIAHENMPSNLIADNPAPINGLPDNKGAGSRKRAGRIN
jgi:hypothetical protein